MSGPPWDWDGKCRCCGQKRPKPRVWSYVICRPFRRIPERWGPITKKIVEEARLARRPTAEWRLIVRAKSFRVQQLLPLFGGTNRKGWKDVQKIARMPSKDKWVWSEQEQAAAVAALNRRVLEWEANLKAEAELLDNARSNAI